MKQIPRSLFTFFLLSFVVLSVLSIYFVAISPTPSLAYQKTLIAQGEEEENESQSPDSTQPSEDQIDSSDPGETPDVVPIEENPIFDALINIINFLLGGIGIFIKGLVVFAGIQYIASGGNPQKIEGAKKMLMSAIFALIMYVFAWALINWLVPGGILN